MRKRYTILLGTALAMAMAGVAFAAFDGVIMGSDGVIYACARTDGTVRLAGSTKTCDASEKAFNWNQRGRTGPTGPTGAPGAPGPAYFARVATTDSGTSKPAGTSIQSWSYSSGLYLYLPYINLSNCAVNGTPVTSQTGATVTRVDVNDHWLWLYTNLNGSRAQYPVDVTIACPSSDNPWSASY